MIENPVESNSHNFGLVHFEGSTSRSQSVHGFYVLKALNVRYVSSKWTLIVKWSKFSKSSLSLLTRGIISCWESILGITSSSRPTSFIHVGLLHDPGICQCYSMSPKQSKSIIHTFMLTHGHMGGVNTPGTNHRNHCPSQHYSLRTPTLFTYSNCLYLHYSLFLLALVSSYFSKFLLMKVR
jgi:hypothetical protein